ncbi:MAG: DUF4958 family protein [Bacteroidales bacterium]|nr:DUF4958 family protein [Bacteroidales bacterium]
MNINRITRKLLAAAAAGVMFAACEPELTDSRTFDLSYPGITDIAPSTNINITPTWIGGTPSDFRVYGVKLDGESYETDCFSADPVSGAFYVRNTDALPTGLYSISISCKCGGKGYKFPDIISINMMRPVPSGIKVEPAVIEAALADILDENSEVVLPTAQITTEGEHISITKYAISSARRNGSAISDFAKMFKVSSTGEVSIIRSSGFAPGEYVLDFKLNTYVVDDSSQEGIFADALTVKVNSAPLALEYVPASGKAEFGIAFSSPAPVLTGTAEGAVYSLKSVSPEGTPLAIDASTGVLSLPEGNTLAIGTVINASVSVTNPFGSKDFDSVFSIEVVDFINPITKLQYADTTVIEGTKVNIALKDADGDDVSYSFVNLPAALEGIINIDAVTGAISLAKGNEAPVGTYTVTVKAENVKGSIEAGFSLKIDENIYKFTYVRWGNNLGLTPVEKYANQFKITSTTDAMNIPVLASDIREGVTASYAIKNGSNSSYITVDAATGQLTIDPTVFTEANNRRVHFCYVEVTTGAGTPAEWKKKIPVFFNFHCAHDGVEVDFVPFVFQCNPRTGGVSTAPTVTGVSDPSQFTLDYRRSFNYFNVAGPESHINGQPKTENSFIRTVWTVFYASFGAEINAESRDPVSIWSKKGTADTKLCYVRKEDYALVVNPEKWKDDAGYANGVFIGQITFGTDGADPAGAAAPRRIFPLAVWFDTAFGNE